MKGTEKYPSLTRVALAVARVTFLEVLRDKLLYNMILISGLLFGLGILAAQLTSVRPERVVLDFGLSAVSLSSLVIGILVGSVLLVREFDRRTIYVALCHPITRFQFILGKFLGLAGILVLNWVLLCGAYYFLLRLFCEAGSPILSPTLAMALVLALIQSLVLASFAIFFSSFSTTSLSIIFSIGFYLIGNNISQIKMIATKVQSHSQASVIHGLALILPNFEYFNFGIKVTYGIPVSLKFFLLSLLYGCILIGFLLGVSGILLQHKEV